jgi:hypothetical protein
MISPNNIIINTKKGLSPKFPFDDPNYVPRIVTIERKVTRNGVEKTIVKKYNTSPVALPVAIREAMNQMPYQNGVAISPHNAPKRKNPRIVNNSKKFNRRGKQVRPDIILRFNKEAMKIIESGDRAGLRNPDGKIKKIHLNKILRKKTNVIADKVRLR